MRRLTRWLMSRPLTRSNSRVIQRSVFASAKPRVEHLEDRVVPARPLPYPILYAGGGFGDAPVVRSFDGDTGEANYTVEVFESSFTGGVNVASADLNADQYPDIVVGAGPGGGPRVLVLDGKTGEQFETAIGSFWAYESEFTGGVVVAAGDVTGDGRPDVISAAASNGGPRVRAFDGRTGKVVADFWAFDEEFQGGLNIAAGDLTLDGRAEILVGAGAGGGPHVRAFDLAGEEPDIATGYPHTDFFTDDPELRFGATVAVGDVNGDHIPDVISAPATGGSARVKVFNGFDGSVMSDFAAFDAGHTAGLRVASFFLTDDGYADIVVSSDADGEGRVRVFQAGTGQLVSGPMADFVPLDEGFEGVRIAAANDPGVYIVSAVASSDPTSFYSGQTFRAGALITHQTKIVPDEDHPPLPPTTPTGTVTFYAQQSSPSTGNSITLGQSTLAAVVGSTTKADAYLTVGGLALDAGSYSLWTSYSGDSNFAVSTSSKITLTVSAATIPPLPPRPDYISNPPVSSGDVYPAGSGLNNLPTLSRGGVRVSDGTIEVARIDFASAILGDSGLIQGWGWTNTSGYDVAEAGDGANLYGLPHLAQVGSTSLAVVTGTSSAIFFDYYDTLYGSRFNQQATIVPGSGNFTVKDGRGNSWVFYDFDAGTAATLRGRLSSATTSDGTTLTVTSRDGSNRPTEIQRVTGAGGSAVTESIVNAYVASGANAGLIESATLRRKVGAGSWSTVRVAEYSYYVNADSNGQDTQLKLAVVKDGSSNVLDTSYYRYYVSGGSAGLMKYVFGPAAYKRLTTDLGTSVDSLTDGQVDDYADSYLEYSGGKVSKHVVAGSGDTAGSAGLGEYTYGYSSNTVQGGSNVWKNKMTETLPDGNQYIYYTNASGQVMLEVHKNVTTLDLWRTYQRFDATGRTVYSAGPSNVTGHNESYADLVNDQGGNFQYLDDSAGLVTVLSYAAATTADSSTAGDAEGYLTGSTIRRGEGGTDVPQSAVTYIKRTAGSKDFFFPAATTQYRADNGTVGQTMTAAYTWISSTAEIESVTTTLPTVTTAQNGPNTATSTVVVNDAFGRPVWSKDADGFLNYVEYDTKTGAVVKTIADVEDANTGDFTGLPSGWTTPVTGGLHLITLYEVDHMGRVTKMTAPNGRVDYSVYNDASHEVRYYPGWISGSNVPTGPITVVREDRAVGYVETLTMSATPSVTSNRPTGAESIASLESLSRSYRNKAGQVTHTDEYFNLSGVTYSTSANIGTLNTNYYRMVTEYRSATDYGLQSKREVSAAGTITRTESDSLGRAISMWVGTDDTPTTGGWSTTNLTGTNMTKVTEYEYDGGGVGDGNLTESTAIPGGGAADRVTQTFYDWRNRAVAVKSGVEGSESTSVNRPIQYFDYDNLNQVVTTRMYDGDAVTITSTSGVPNAPSSSLLRAKSGANYDELGRVYLSEIYTVDPSSGSVGSYTLQTNTWFDKRGNVLKTSSLGGLVQKMTTDGVGNVTASYSTDGGGDSSWSDADDVTGDIVLSQNETAYDKSGLVLVSTHRDRFHDATDTGVLGNPSSSSGTAKARVSYVGYYYDAGDRTTAVVDVGSNGGSAWSRPGSVPSRSDSVLVGTFSFDTAGLLSEATDPRGIVDRVYYDDIGRTAKTIQNYVDGTVGDDNDKTAEYVYGPAGMMSLTAKLTGGGVQTTEWVYGVSGGSGITSNDIVGEIRWPDSSTGSASSSEDEDVTVNALGETLTSEDRNGTVHTLTYDVLGRVTVDTVTTVGSGIDSTVRRVETAYDGQGNAYLIASFDATTSGNIVTQIQWAFNGLGQMTREWQSHGGAVNTGSTPSVQYDYSEMPSGANHSRLTSITYPDGYVLTYNYASGLNGDISRLSSLSDSGGTLESYDYLGLGTVVKRSHSTTAVDLTFLGTGPGSGGDQYVGLDSFGRIIDQNWKPSGASTDRFTYTYDRDGNRLTKGNSVNSSFNESYSYDNLNQLTNFTRGAHTQAFDFDAAGNFDSVTTDGGSPQTRTHNKQNEVTAVTGATSPTFDANGNMTTDETGKQYVYDAWNRLKIVKNSGGSTLKTYVYDVLGRRVAEAAGGVTTDFYYSVDWQVLEERDTARTNDTKIRYVWSPVYVDAMILRDRDTADDGTLEERLWVQQDANWNVAALTNSAGTVLERYVYDPYGVATVLNASWSSIGSSAYGWVYLHQSGRLDATSGLYHFRNREYSPTLGRWTAMDPLGFGANDVNLARYVGNGPTNGVDPSGLQVEFGSIDEATGVVTLSGFNPKVGKLTVEGWFDREDGWLPFYAEYVFDELLYDPAKRTVQAVGDVVRAPLDPYYQPNNPHIAGFWNGERSLVGATADLILDGAVVAGTAKGARSLLKPSKSCFPAGTPVHVEGGLKPIEQVVVGDRVWSYDHYSLRWVLRSVLETFTPRHDGTMATLWLEVETIRATGGHPFWVVAGLALAERPHPKLISAYVAESRQAGRWVLAEDLRAGDVVVLRDGRTVPVEQVAFANGSEQVYNFHVEGLENYAVGTCGVLVHNTNNAPAIPQKVNTTADATVKGAGKVADSVPSNVPKNWSPDVINNHIVDYERSISVRKAEVEAFDRVGGGNRIQRMAHIERIAQEEQFLHQLRRALTE